MNPSPWRDPRTGKRRGSSRYEQRERLRILNHYRWTCQLCHLPINPRLRSPHPMSATVHHLIPAPGYSLNHCVAAHRECNFKAGSPGKIDPEPRGQTLW
jgi:hypothetical protein